MPTTDELYDEANKLKNAGNLEDAAAKLETLLAQEETYALAHSALGVIYGKLGKHDEAVRHAERVCELAPTDPYSFTAASVIYQRAFAGTGNREFIQKAEDAMARSRMM